uniref:Uncharacterized protein n=1 Tax=Rhizophora mucronata TaxID=61149 RepID=A0A2P2Q171_RHIMU
MAKGFMWAVKSKVKRGRVK